MRFASKATVSGEAEKTFVQDTPVIDSIITLPI